MLSQEPYHFSISPLVATPHIKRKDTHFNIYLKRKSTRFQIVILAQILITSTFYTSFSLYFTIGTMTRTPISYFFPTANCFILHFHLFLLRKVQRLLLIRVSAKGIFEEMHQIILNKDNFYVQRKDFKEMESHLKCGNLID